MKIKIITKLTEFSLHNGSIILNHTNYFNIGASITTTGLIHRHVIIVVVIINHNRYFGSSDDWNRAELPSWDRNLPTNFTLLPTKDCIEVPLTRGK
eukprot:UN06767